MEKKKKMKIIIPIVILLLIVVIGGGVGGYYIYQQHEKNKSVGTEWGDKYYVYMKEAIEEEDHVFGLPKDIEDTKMQFIDVNDNEPPIMAITYNLEGTRHAHLFYFNDNDEIAFKYYTQPSSFQLLYNIELEQYIWYVNVEEGNKHSYKSLESQVQKSNNTTDNENSINRENTTSENVTTNNTNTSVNDSAANVEVDAEYTFTEEEMQSQEVAEGEIPTISKFDETFIVPDIEENETSIDLNEETLKEEVRSAVGNYKTQEQIVTEETKEKTDEKVKELENKKKEIKKAEEEKAQKEAEEQAKAEEEARKKAEEEAKKGLKVGNDIVKYGTYKGKYAAEGETLIIRADGTATLKTSAFTEDYIYTVGKYNFSQDTTPHYLDAIIFRIPRASSADAMALYVHEDGSLCEDPNAYVYAGE